MKAKKPIKKQPTWVDLFDYVAKRVDVRYAGAEKPENMRFTCHHDFQFVQEFLAKHPEVAWGAVFKQLTETGGFCDCEVLWNSARQIKTPHAVLPTLAGILRDKLRAEKTARKSRKEK